MNKEIQSDFRLAAEKLFEEIRWIDETHGYVPCPGKARHTTVNQARDCILYVDKIPTVYCVHSSCREAISLKNKVLRATLMHGTLLKQNRSG